MTHDKHARAWGFLAVLLLFNFISCAATGPSIAHRSSILHGPLDLLLVGLLSLPGLLGGILVRLARDPGSRGERLVSLLGLLATLYWVGIWLVSRS